MEIWKRRLPPRISPSETQIPADKLINYDKFKDVLEKLEKSPRIEVFSGGRTHKQMEIYYLVISDPENIKNLFYYKTIAEKLSGPRIKYNTLTKANVEDILPSELGDDAKITVLLHAASWPFEAAHTEAMIEMANILAYSEEPIIKTILKKEIIVIIPMMCPDGRELAIEEWRRFPLSDGRAGAGNLRGSALNRDFSRMAEPETTAVHHIYNDWSPSVAYDPHEDMMLLGINPDWPELCWCPPYARPYYKDLDQRIRENIKVLGDAIAKRWKEEGFNFRYHPEGKEGLLDELGLGSQCFDLHFALHGTSVIVTESARTPGTNSWKERIDQKVTAALAILEKTAENPLQFIDTKYKIRKENLAGEKSAYIIPTKSPEQRDPFAASLLVKNLLKCKIQVYHTRMPYEAYVVPTNQPEKNVILDMLSVNEWYPWSLSPGYGVTLTQLEFLTAHEQEGFANAPLRYIDVPVIVEGQIRELVLRRR